jgi:hypothetical protein
MSVMATTGKRAMQGYQVGGPWGAVAGAVIGFFEGSDAQRKLEHQFNDALKANAKRNDALLMESARAYSEISRQRAALNIKTSQALYYYQRQAGDQKGEILNSFAAQDQIGTSALALTSLVDTQRDSAVAQTVWNHQQEIENTNTQVHNLENETLNQISDVIGMAATLHEDIVQDLFAMGESYMSMQGGGAMGGSSKSSGSGTETNSNDWVSTNNSSGNSFEFKSQTYGGNDYYNGNYTSGKGKLSTQLGVYQ